MLTVSRCHLCSSLYDCVIPSLSFFFCHSTFVFHSLYLFFFFFFFQAEDGIRDLIVTGVQTCALPILTPAISAATTGSWKRPAAWPARCRGSGSSSSRGAARAASAVAAEAAT